MTRSSFVIASGGFGLVMCLSVTAGPIQVSQSAFTSPTIITFGSIGNEVPITSQFSGSGVTFSGGVYGLTNPGDTMLFPGPPTAIASDWRYSLGVPGSLPITVTFGSVQNLLGFLEEVNLGDSTVITTYLNGVSDGSVTFASPGGNPAVFLGISDANGFNSITINVTGTSNQFLAFDQFQFQGGTVSSVPEPGYIYATTGVLAVFVLALRRRTVRRDRRA